MRCDVSAISFAFIVPSIVIVVILFFTKLPLLKRQQRNLSGFESSCHLPTSLPHTVEAAHCPFNLLTSSKEAVFTNIFVVFDTGTRTPVYLFSSSYSIHSTTDL